MKNILIDNKVKKILLIKLRGIGDVILSTVVFDNLINAFPEAKIDFLSEKPSFPALNGLDQINSIHIFDRKSIKNRIKLILKIRKMKYDLVIDMFSNPSTAQITFLSGARFRLGFPYKGRKYAYNILGTAVRNKLHSADLHLALLKAANIKIFSNNLYCYLSKTDLTFVNKYYISNYLKDNRVVILSPSGGWASKRIPASKFAEIGDYLHDTFQVQILIVWGPGDKIDAVRIKALMKSPVYLAPNTTINQMGAFFKKSLFVISNDSGPMHISAAVGAPTLSIHGPTDPNLQGAYGSNNLSVRFDELECIGCNLLDCNKNQECFNDLPIERIASAIKKLIILNDLKV